MRSAIPLIVSLIFLLPNSVALSQGTPRVGAVLEVLNVLIKPQDVQMGILYKLSDTQETKSVSVTSSSSSESQVQTIRQDQSDSSTVTQDLAASFNAGASLTNVVAINIGAKVSSGYTSHRQLTWSDLRTYQRSTEFTNAASDTQTTTKTATISYGENDGFIHTGIYIVNRGAKKVLLKDIRVSVVLTDAAGLTMDAVETTTLVAGQQTYSSASDKNATPPSTPPEGLEVSLMPQEDFTQGINWKNVNTALLLQWLADDRAPQLLVEYKIFVDDVQISPKAEIDSVMKRAVSLRVINDRGDDQQFYIDTQASTDGRISVVDALRSAGFNDIATSTASNGTQFLSVLGGRKADCAPSDLDSLDEARKQPSAGSWIVGTSPFDSFTGAVGDAAPAGTHFVVAFVTRAQRAQALAKPVQLSQPLKIPTNRAQFVALLADLQRQAQPLPPSWAAADFARHDLQPRVVIGLVRNGDLITLRVRGDHSGFSVSSVTSPHPTGWYPAGLLAWAQAQEFVPDSNIFPLPLANTVDDVGLAVNLGTGPIPLQRIVPRGRQWFDTEPDGTVTVRFMITDAILKTDQAVLALEAIPVFNTLDIGRTVSPPPPNQGGARVPGMNNDPYQAADFWVKEFPKGKKSVPEARYYDVQGEILPNPLNNDIPPVAAVAPASEDEKTAKTFAESWLALVDSGKFAEAWSSWARQQLGSVEGFSSMITAERARVDKRTLNAIQLTQDELGITAGPYMLVQYKSHVLNGRFIFETLFLVRQQDVWKVDGYYFTIP